MRLLAAPQPLLDPAAPNDEALPDPLGRPPTPPSPPPAELVPVIRFLAILSADYQQIVVVVVETP
jgi:hypothetical protein